jgi:hypothetical protein
MPSCSTPDGKMKLPTGYREWVFIGSPLTPNALNNGKAAFRSFEKTTHQRPNPIHISGRPQSNKAS